MTNIEPNRLSLTDSDISTIRSSLPRLVGEWLLLTEFGEEGELYGRVIPPWGNGQKSAFLFEREDDVIILTDNLSESDMCIVMNFPSAALAAEAVLRVVQGGANRPIEQQRNRNRSTPAAHRD